MREGQRNTSRAYLGTKYFSCDGKVLDEIRKGRETFEVYNIKLKKQL